MCLRIIQCSVFEATVFCLGEKQGMIVNDDCSLWNSRVSDFLMLVWERREEISYGEGSAYKVLQSNPTVECEANGNNCYGS